MIMAENKRMRVFMILVLSEFLAQQI